MNVRLDYCKHMTSVHLVGSFPCETEEEVFRTVMGELSGSLRRVPDGETGVRKGWVAPLVDTLSEMPGMELSPPRQDAGRKLPQLRLTKPASAIEFGPLGYVEHSRASYRVFRQLRDEGVIPAGVRLQICFPTPLNVVGRFVVPADQSEFYHVYERAVLSEIAMIQGEVPHEDLAIQWDVVMETAILEQVEPAPDWFGDSAFENVVAMLGGLGTAVQPVVDLGYHFCYGYHERRHFKEPENLGLLARMANAAEAQVGRRIDFIQIPVPVDRADKSYFEPLLELELADTELYLGVVNEDGLEPSKERAAAAKAVLDGRRSFGVATECGLGQFPLEQAVELLHIHGQLETS